MELDDDFDYEGIENEFDFSDEEWDEFVSYYTYPEADTNIAGVVMVMTLCFLAAVFGGVFSLGVARMFGWI